MKPKFRLISLTKLPAEEKEKSIDLKTGWELNQTRGSATSPWSGQAVINRVYSFTRPRRKLWGVNIAQSFPTAMEIKLHNWQLNPEIAEPGADLCLLRVGPNATNTRIIPTARPGCWYFLFRDQIWERITPRDINPQISHTILGLKFRSKPTHCFPGGQADYARISYLLRPVDGDIQLFGTL